MNVTPGEAQNPTSSTDPEQQTLEGIAARTEIEIDAPIEVVWEVMENLDAYPEWNPFIVKVDEIKGGTDVGGRFNLNVKWADGSGTISPELVVAKIPPTEDESGKKTATWSYQFQGLLNTVSAVQATRNQTLSELPGNRTRYGTEEQFEGWLAMGVPLDKVQDGFERHAKALKAQSEFVAARKRNPFPANVPVSQQPFENWARDIKVSSVLTCVPRTPEDIVDIVNWGDKNGYKVRPRGMMHNWSPLTLSPDEDASKVLLVDMTQHLTQVESIEHNEEGGTITIQAGATMEKLLTELQNENLGFIATPAPGDLTIGGVMAIAAHGTGLPPKSGEQPAKGHTYGSLSNSVLSLTAVVWDEKTEKYKLRKFERSDPECQAFLAHLGRAFIVDMTLQAGPNQRLRCKSEMVPAAELYAPLGSSGRTFEKYMNENQGVEAIQFPGSDEVWMKSWSIAPEKPPESREVNRPFNYTFSDNLPEALSKLVPQAVAGAGRLTPAFGQLLNSIASAGLSLTNTADLWGWSKDLLLYIKPDTLRVTANGYAIHTKRENVQDIVKKFKQIYEETIKKYEELGAFPANGPLEIRVTGLDHAKEVSADGAREPQLSPLRPDSTHPERDVAVYLDILTIPGTELSNEFYAEVEQRIFEEFNGPESAVYPEWSKGWGYTKDGPWTNREVMEKIVPNVLSEGRPKDDNFYTALETLQKYDPKRLFTSPMLDKLLPQIQPGLKDALDPRGPEAGLGTPDSKVVTAASLDLQKSRKPEEIWQNLPLDDRKNILQALADRGCTIPEGGQPMPSDGTAGMNVNSFVRLCDGKNGEAFIANLVTVAKTGKFTVVRPELKVSLVEDDKGKLKGRLSTKAPEQGRKPFSLK